MRVLLHDLRRVWGAADQSRRLAYGVVITLMLAGGWLVWGQTLSADYAPVYTNLTSEDIGAIAGQLQQQGVTYRVGPGGTSLLVPAEAVDRVRVALAAAGLPHGQGVGFELFDKSSLGLSDAQQRVSFQRAIQGELERVIAKMDGVSGARVLIALPGDTLFMRDQAPATASVFVRTNGASLNESQVRTIAFLVSRAVSGLKPESVAITDQLATDYSSLLSPTSDASGASSRQLAIKRGYEHDLARSLTSMLNTALGVGHASVQVAATFDWDTFEKNATVLGLDPVLVSKQEKVEKFTSNGSPAPASGGTPGASSNLPATGGAAKAAAKGQDYSNTQTTTNFDISRSVEKTVRAPGSIKKQFISVLVDKDPVDPALPDIRTAVTAAAGVDVARGDVVIVTGMKFDRAQLTEATKKLEDQTSAAGRGDLLRTGGATLLALGAGALLFLFLRRLPSPALAALPTPEEVRFRPGEPLRGRSLEDIEEQGGRTAPREHREEHIDQLRRAAEVRAVTVSDGLRTILHEEGKG